MKIKKKDTVLVIAGKDRGKKGKVLRAFPKENRISVEGVNILKKHVRPKESGKKGQIVEFPSLIDASNVKFFHEKCKNATRLVESEGKRICKKCGKEV